MTTPNNQPTPPEGYRSPTEDEIEHGAIIPPGTLKSMIDGSWQETKAIGLKFDNIFIYAIPSLPTVPATGDTNEKGGEQRQELLPCPFCGPDYPRFSERAPGNSPWTEDYGYWETGCAQCGIKFHGADQEEAEERWNTRK